MGYRYSDRELDSLRSDSVLRDARRIARAGDAPIDPDRDDYEAIEFLFDIKMAVDEMKGEDLGQYGFVDRANELSDDVVPYNNYKAAMAYAQLGLYDYDTDYTTAMMGLSDGSQMDNIRLALFSFANIAITSTYATTRTLGYNTDYD